MQMFCCHRSTISLYYRPVRRVMCLKVFTKPD
ncbi:hypothetical protein DET0508 [Dehalococcoides mccartyi 195]|uniref:Uncharacterized protein n=1 Tax=Dehalococcoides mccartyi (strain ATCC BAA-2266 / KCTC 15142 / 195) TaxID=243164 RepID=Q3Z947_DEHM1|nr:hypothetical protein DET0508 [Dehalococcoides mccartyi 195]